MFLGIIFLRFSLFIGVAQRKGQKRIHQDDDYNKQETEKASKILLSPAYHLQHNRIRIPIRHHPRKRSPASHPVAPGVIQDDQVAAALLDGFGG